LAIGKHRDDADYDVDDGGGMNRSPNTKDW